MVAYKLFRLRKDGSLGSLFFAPKERLPIHTWLRAKHLRKKGFAYRPGWHACASPNAPHLTTKGRVWCRVTIADYAEHTRPPHQGGKWFTAAKLRIDEVLPQA